MAQVVEYCNGWSSFAMFTVDKIHIMAHPTNVACVLYPSVSLPKYPNIFLSLFTILKVYSVVRVGRMREGYRVPAMWWT